MSPPTSPRLAGGTMKVSLISPPRPVTRVKVSEAEYVGDLLYQTRSSLKTVGVPITVWSILLPTLKSSDALATVTQNGHSPACAEIVAPALMPGPLRDCESITGIPRPEFRLGARFALIPGTNSGALKRLFDPLK